MRNNRRLKRELVQAGAKSHEINELSIIASNLKLLRRSNKKLISTLKPALLAASGLVIGVALVMISLSASPTSWLYPMQKLSDKVAISVNPSYRATVMMQRAEQVNQLVASHASTKVILATLNSYQTVAASYKSMPNTNYAAFDYCKTNLMQAAAIAPTSVKQAIISSISTLSNT